MQKEITAFSWNPALWDAGAGGEGWGRGQSGEEAPCKTEEA